MKGVAVIAGGFQLRSISAVYVGRSTCRQVVAVIVGGVQLRSISAVYGQIYPGESCDHNNGWVFK